MPDILMLSVPDYSATIELLRQVNHTTWLYLAAAIVARFWHKHIWAVYLAHAIISVIATND